jgi:hypothetical protein
MTELISSFIKQESDASTQKHSSWMEVEEKPGSNPVDLKSQFDPFLYVTQYNQLINRTLGVSHLICLDHLLMRCW